MGLVDLRHLSTEMFLMGILFFLIFGSLFSWGFMRLFQGHIKSGLVFMGITVVGVAVLLYVLKSGFI